MDWLNFGLRWLHIVAAIAAVGGTIFMRMAVVPAAQGLADETRAELYAQIRRRWAMVVHASIGFLIISGIINFLLLVFAARQPAWADWKATYEPTYHMVFGIKFLLALVVFFIAEALVGRGAATQKIRDNAKTWLNVNVALALVIVALSGILRLTHVGPTLTETPKISQTDEAAGG